ncbi:hypothetical protein A2U01_0095443, partial [Trifolium medium]|nr:hypothetical protein [Trifolium medium]
MAAVVKVIREKYNPQAAAASSVARVPLGQRSTGHKPA